MNWPEEVLNHEFVRRGLLGGALGGLLCGYAGAWAVVRRMALMTDALSHAMFPGLAIAAALSGLSPLGLLLGGCIAAMFVAGGAEIVSRTSRLKPEAAIAILYTGSYALGLAVIPSGGARSHLEHWLFGDIFALGDSDLCLLWGATIITVPALIALERPLALAVMGEDVARSMGIRTASVKCFSTAALVVAAIVSFKAGGVVPSVASLIAPGASMRLVTNRLSVMLWGSALLGTAGAVAGILLSCSLDFVSGGVCIALVQCGLFLGFILFSPASMARFRQKFRQLIKST